MNLPRLLQQSPVLRAIYFVILENPGITSSQIKGAVFAKAPEVAQYVVLGGQLTRLIRAQLIQRDQNNEGWVPFQRNYELTRAEEHIAIRELNVMPSFRKGPIKARKLG